jgi:glutamate-5-semialdehyde dehydrogenase
MNNTDIVLTLTQARQAYLLMTSLPTAVKNNALICLAKLIDTHHIPLLQANQQDLAEASATGLTGVLLHRLKLDANKLTQLADALREVANLPDPAGAVLSKTLLDDGLVLLKRSVPIGVIGIVFESRPDVIPQILSLILKSGNAVVLKGGQEALHSNRAFMALLPLLAQAVPELPAHWAQLLESREDFRAMLAYPNLLDLVIPRGSNQLVQSIMAATKIPVLGHADGICHFYWHPSAIPQQALALVLDSKIQYPSACNALETLLLDKAVASHVLPLLMEAASNHGLTLKGCPDSRMIAPALLPTTEDDWRTEYGDLTLAIRLVASIDEAIAHINQYGSKHTDGILAQDQAAIAHFCATVDSASVMSNASTRFADGFRYGLGAEVGISTAKTHARGPVGLEGLVIYQYVLTGNGHMVSQYVGPQAKPFKHQLLPTIDV